MIFSHVLSDFIVIFTRFHLLPYGFFSNLWYNISTIKTEHEERGAEMMYNALDVARYIIDYEATQGRTVSNLRLQKLLYFVQCVFLGILGRLVFLTKSKPGIMDPLSLRCTALIKNMEVPLFRPWGKIRKTLLLLARTEI